MCSNSSIRRELLVNRGLRTYKNVRNEVRKVWHIKFDIEQERLKRIQKVWLSCRIATHLRHSSQGEKRWVAAVWWFLWGPLRLVFAKFAYGFPGELE